MAVTKCLPPLVKTPGVKAISDELVGKMVDQISNGKSYGERRGGAFGLAGLIKGLGIIALKNHDVIAKVTSAAEDRSSSDAREGGLMAFEALCSTLGMLFEPYVTAVLPILLNAFADSVGDVRAAAQAAARAVMAKLSTHGIKIVLPTLLESIQGKAWRTKQAAVKLLGAMSYCAPKQLASCLPEIVPRLVNAITDSHPKVRTAGKSALDDVGSVAQS